MAIKIVTNATIKRYVRDGKARDITNWSDYQLEEFRRDISDREIIMKSRDENGPNGMLIRDRRTGDLYAVTARNSAYFYLY